MHGRLLPIKLLLLLLLVTASGCTTLGFRPVTMKSLLREMTDREAVARWPSPEYVVKQASSYDRASLTPADAQGWFANSDHGHFIRTENHHGQPEHVLLDVDGPGCLVRMWFTSSWTTDTLRVYVDGATQPIIEATFEDLFEKQRFVNAPLAIDHGRIAGQDDHPGGMNLYLPIPFARHCKVTWSDGGKQSRYYNLEYRLYPRSTKVKSASPATLATCRPLMGGVGKALLDPPPVAGPLTARDLDLTPGAAATMDLPDGPAAVTQLELQCEGLTATTAEQVLRGAILRIEFDGQETVSVPAGDFFGSGFGLNPLQSWYRTVTRDGKLSCRWIMPYRKSGRISLENRSPLPLRARLAATTGKWRWNKRSMYFHSNWRQENNISSRPTRDWNYLNVTGRGIYLGDTLALYNPVPEWWGEGDEKIFRDGEYFPSHFGTGTEDYYGYAWCSPTLFQGPFSNQVRCDGPRNQGHTTVTRVRGLDRLPFSHSLRFDMELLTWIDTKVDYAVTTYWYGADGARHVPESVAPPPDAPGGRETISAGSRRQENRASC